MSMTMREAFEAWQRESNSSLTLPRSGDGYMVPAFNLEWIVWRAAWSAFLRALAEQEPVAHVQIGDRRVPLYAQPQQGTADDD